MNSLNLIFGQRWQESRTPTRTTALMTSYLTDDISQIQSEYLMSHTMSKLSTSFVIKDTTPQILDCSTAKKENTGSTQENSRRVKFSQRKKKYYKSMLQPYSGELGAKQLCSNHWPKHTSKCISSSVISYQSLQVTGTQFHCLENERVTYTR